MAFAFPSYKLFQRLYIPSVIFVPCNNNYLYKSAVQISPWNDEARNRWLKVYVCVCVVKCKLSLMMNVFHHLLVHEVLRMWIYVYDEKFLTWNDLTEKKFKSYVTTTSF